VDQALVSLVDKELMKEKLNKVFETIKVFNKANLVEKVNSASVRAEEIAQAAKAAAKQLVVCQVDFGSDGKVAKKIHDKLKAAHNEGSFFVISLDEDDDKYVSVSLCAIDSTLTVVSVVLCCEWTVLRLGAYPVVSAAHQAAGVSAKAWVDFVLAGVGAGKGGGKAETAMASIPQGSALVDKVLALAEQYAESKIAGDVFVAK
jgi:hypothetical protein